MEYFREHEMLDAAVDGRMTILPSTAQTGLTPAGSKTWFRPAKSAGNTLRTERSTP